MDMEEYPAPTPEPFVEQARRRRRGLWTNARAAAMVAFGLGLMLWGDLRDGSLDWSLAFDADRCPQIRKLVADDPPEPMSSATLELAIPIDAPGGYVPTVNAYVDLEDAVAGHEGAEAEWRRAFMRHGYVEGWQRVWEKAPGETLMVLVYTSKSAKDAHGLHAWATDHACHWSHDVFEVDGVGGSVGQQYTHGGGFTSEQVSFVRGSRRYLVQVRTAADEVDRELLAEFTRTVDEVASE